MTPQQAYNKGLDDAENLAIEKINKALDGYDDIPFNNPKMEEIRQRILSLSHNKSDSYVLKILLDQPYEKDNVSKLDLKLIETMEYVRSLVSPKRSSKISVKLKCFFSALNYEFINHKLNS